MDRAFGRTRQYGFTLVEVLVVIAIIGILVALLMPAVQYARESSRRASCLNNLKQHGIALNSYITSVDALPIGYISWRGETAPGWAWSAALLPQLEQGPTYSAININLPIDVVANFTARTATQSIYICPSDRQTGSFATTSQLVSGPIQASTISYAASGGVNTSRTGIGLFLQNKSVRPKDMKDGASNTIAVGERASFVVKNAWAGAISNGGGGSQVLAQPLPSGLNPSSPSPTTFASPHTGLVQFLIGDGSARPINVSVNAAVFQALTTRAGGEVISQVSY
jgi:prepilin-type N-terminal cleavage/methylation domain-containing protein